MFNIGDHVEYLYEESEHIRKGEHGIVTGFSSTGLPQVQWNNGYHCNKAFGHTLHYLKVIDNPSDYETDIG